MSNIYRALIILSVIGLLVSIYLTVKTYDPSSVTCSIGGGCQTVLSSDYARLFGIPLAVYGVVWYFLQIIIVFLIYVKSIKLDLQLKLWTAMGLLFSLVLLYIEAFVINAYCTWCLVSLGIVSLSTILVFWPRLKRSK